MVGTQTPFGNIQPTRIEDEMRTSYLDYAMSVIVSRALPDVRDGLKPVQRRILYAMHDMNMGPNSSYKKSARIVGEVLGKYHPHGDSAVYLAMVRMAQPWSMRLPLIDGQGNFGSQDDDPPAAMRYTEARLASISQELLSNLEQDTVDFRENFDESVQEPQVLPTRLPNLLANGASGIAVGMATNIPPHNPKELCDAVISLIEDPEATIDDLMKIVKGPDFPTGGTIMGREGIRNAFNTGRGQVIVRAEAEIQPIGKRNNRMQIVVSELPYQVNKASLVEKIARLAKDKKIDGITEIRDESDRNGMRIVIELRSGSQPQIVLNQLYKQTALQSSFSTNMVALVDNTPKLINLKQALQHFITFRQSVVRRRSEFELKRAQARAHILAGLRIALSNLDAVIALIRGSANVEEARNGLISGYGLDEKQAQAILEMQLRRLAALERERLEEEYKQLQETIRELQELLGDNSKVLEEVRQETIEIKKKLRQPRKTSITNAAHDLSREELEEHAQIVVTLSQGGYIKRIPSSTYRNQRRGGRGVVGMTTKDDDPVKQIVVVDTHDTLLFFTNKGRVLAIKAYELRADTSRNTRGTPVFNVIPLSDMERVCTVIGVDTLKRDGDFLILGTLLGKIKRVPLIELTNIRTNGLIIMNVGDKDELIDACLSKEEDDIVFVTREGMSVRFASTDVTPRKRAAGGSRGIRLRGKDVAVFMGVVNDDEKHLIVISEKGIGKLTKMEEYRRQGRGGIGIKTIEIKRRTGPLVAAQIVDDSMELYVLSAQAQVLRTSLSQIRKSGRNTQGVRIIKPANDDIVSAISCVPEFDTDTTSEVIEEDKPQDGNNSNEQQKKLL